MNPLPREFYLQDTVTVAKSLLGCVLVRRVGNATLVGRIVETEAYLGPEDPACHSARGRTKRTEVMFGEGGKAYVYLIYGMHYNLNAVTGPEGQAHGVLIRAVEPVEGVDAMKANRPAAKDVYSLCNGPGKLCAAFSIGKDINGADLTGGRPDIRIAGGTRIKDAHIVTSTRIGIREAADLPLRFYIKGSPYVSRT